MFMEIAALFLHNARVGDCPAWVIYGHDIDVLERSKINEEMGYLVPFRQDAGYNEWHFIKHGADSCSARKFTWTNPIYGNMIEVLKEVKGYYRTRGPVPAPIEGGK